MTLFRTQCKVWNILADGPQSKQDHGHSAHSGKVVLICLLALNEWKADHKFVFEHNHA